jgi:hypothetical protein
VSLFQYVALTGLGILLLWEVFGRSRWLTAPVLTVARCTVWVLAAAAVEQPDLVQWTAQFLGIGRGADVLLYGMVFAFLGTSFYLYARLLRQENQITEVVRHLALREPRRLPAERGAVEATTSSET